MNEKKYKRSRILLMYITKVSGHRQATVAIQRSLKQLDSTIEAPTVNGFGFTLIVLLYSPFQILTTTDISS